MRGVDHLSVCESSAPSERPEQIFPDAAPRPANKPVIDRGWGTIFGWAIAPATTAFQHMHNATDDAPIVHPFDASHIRRQMRLDPLPLLIAQPKQVPPHDPDPPKTNQVIWNQDCCATAAKLMSSQPSKRCWQGEPGMRPLNRFLRDESAAAAIEYGLIAAGVSVAIVHVVGTLGAQLMSTFGIITSSLQAAGK
jgi:pilus assembly protein Flp/PilA